MVIRLVELLEFLRWLSGIDAFKNAQSSEVLDGQLQFSYRLGPADVLGYETSFACFKLAHLVLLK